MRRIPAEGWMVVVALLWGSAFPLTGVLLHELQPLAAGGWRAFFAALAVLGFALLRREGRSLVPASHRLHLLVMVTLGGPIFLVGMNVGISLTGASITTFVAGLYPMIAVIAATVLFREPLTRSCMVGLGVSVVGLTLLSRPGGAHVDLVGVAFGLMAALSFGTYLALTRRWGDPAALPPLTIAIWLLIANTVVAFGAQWVIDPAGLALTALTAVGWVALVWLALPASALPHVLVVTTLRRLPAAQAAPFLLLMPITGALLSALLLGERLDLVQLVGAGLILVGVGLAIRPSSVAAPVPSV
jgi:drug/metabolite transporter (DMT)-like permease